tara:strand:+ start:2110 stop:2355 length:246 start_codon:yes stop_codon:yes gene_type:complete
MLLHTTLGYLSFLFITTLNYNYQRNKDKTVMSFFAHLLKTPNRHADDFGVFHASQTQKSQLPLASKTNNSTSLELKTTSPA